MGVLNSNCYINVHTHHDRKSEQEFSVRNIFLQEATHQLINLYRFASIGLHPWHITQANTDTIFQDLDNYAKLETILAIGEIGLDKLIDTDFDRQKEIFETQVKIAEQNDKTIIIHSVKAYSDLIAIRKKRNTNLPWIIHGFNENKHIASKLIDLNCYLSFGRQLFNGKSKAFSTFSQLDISHIFLETDEDQINIEQVYRIAARLKKKSIPKLQEHLIHNFKHCFDRNENLYFF